MIKMRRVTGINPTQVFASPSQEAVGFFFRLTPPGDMFGKRTTTKKNSVWL